MRLKNVRLVVALSVVGSMLALPALAGNEGPGAPGIGDSYFPGLGNSGYDVDNYDIRLNYEPSTDLLKGTTTIVAHPTQDLTRFNLDFALKPTTIRVNGRIAAFRQSGTEVEVTPPTPLRTGRLATFVVEYADTPSTVLVNGRSRWARTADGAVVSGEPESAAWWFPSNDHPLDKATFDVSVSVPNGTQVISTGVKSETRPGIGHRTRWSWRSAKPQATYLSFLAIGQYEITEGVGYKGQPMINAYSKLLEPGILGSARASIERTPEAIEFLEGWFGDWPFDVQGGVAIPRAGGALETQTRPVYGTGSFARDENMYYVVHELSHQWFGDSVSVADWRNIWLNEGFATFAEWLWSEAKGEGTTQELFDYQYATRPPAFWTVAPGDPGAANLFDSAVYKRGGMTLHLLRKTIGDDAMRLLFKTWVTDHRYGNATIEDFIALAEKTSGRELDELFQEWLFTPGKPTYGVTESRVNPPKPMSFDKIDEDPHAGFR